MSITPFLADRAEHHCELCGSDRELGAWAVTPADEDDPDRHVYACALCREQMSHPDQADPNHWRCLNDSMWKPVPAVQVASWRMLHHLAGEGWPQDLLDMLYLDEDTLDWARSGLPVEETEHAHRDCHGQRLEAGDSVLLTKDLTVKGAGFTAKRGTAVRNISLVADNPDQIEGRVNGQQIVILTRFVKKSG